MSTLLLLALLGQAAPVPTPDVATCDLTAVPVVCDIPALGSTTLASSGEDLCAGSFVENCKRHALAVCSLSVGQIKASVRGSTATCSVTCAGQTFQQNETCELNATSPIAKCLYPACPPGCLECVDLQGSLDCRFVAISDDPDPVPGTGFRGGNVRFERRSAAGAWVCK